MKPGDIQEYAGRARAPVAASKREYWAEHARDGEGLAALHAGWDLHEHARAVLPEFPTAQYLAEDLAHHQRLKVLFDRASQAFSLRRSPR